MLERFYYRLNFYCTICGIGFDGNLSQALIDGWVFKIVHGIEHVHCPKHAQEKIEGE